jgi:hypothetical protein
MERFGLTGFAIIIEFWNSAISENNKQPLLTPLPLTSLQSEIDSEPPVLSKKIQTCS